MKKPIHTIVAALAFAFALVAVAAEQNSVSVIKTINYKPSVQECLLDLSIPQGVKDFPTVVWYHGGGLTSGHRHFIDIDTNRIAIVAVEYRLMKTDEKGSAIKGGPISPADIMDDCAAAAAWVKKHIAEYGGEPSKIYIAGHSAGGYITYMLGLRPEFLAAYSCKPSDFAGYLPLSGQASKHFAVRQYFGQGENQLNPVFDEWAPIHLAKGDAPPFLIMLGDKRIEWPMRVQESEYLYEIFKALGHKNVEFHSYPDCNHGTCYGPAMKDIQRFILERK